MDVVLAGTGPATGFPVPGCSCAACSASAQSASAQSVAAPTTRRPAQLRLGPDRGPHWWLDVDCVVHGPDGVLHHPGTEGDLPGFVIRTLSDDDGRVALLLRGTAEPAAFLWAPQVGRISDVLLEQLGATTLAAVFIGPPAEFDPAEPLAEDPPLIDCAHGLARLRQPTLAGQAAPVGPASRCFVVGVGHRAGPADRLASCLAHWGAQAPSDGTRITLGPEGESADPQLAGRTLILGGSASGKSLLAEHLLAASAEVLYVATGQIPDEADDPEWARRVRHHQHRRPAWWQTMQTHQVAAALATTDQPVLLDAVGSWLTGVLDRSGAWQNRAGWHEELAAETKTLMHAWRARRGPLVAVTDEVGWGVVPQTAAGRLFRDELGRINRRLAAESERVLIVVAGRLLLGSEPGQQ